MAEVIADWQRADSDHLNTYRRVMRLTALSMFCLAIVLASLALIVL